MRSEFACQIRSLTGLRHATDRVGYLCKWRYGPNCYGQTQGGKVQRGQVTWDYRCSFTRILQDADPGGDPRILTFQIYERLSDEVRSRLVAVVQLDLLLYSARAGDPQALLLPCSVNDWPCALNITVTSTTRAGGVAGPPAVWPQAVRRASGSLVGPWAADSTAGLHRTWSAPAPKAFASAAALPAAHATGDCDRGSAMEWCSIGSEETTARQQLASAEAAARRLLEYCLHCFVWQTQQYAVLLDNERTAWHFVVRQEATARAAVELGTAVQALGGAEAEARAEIQVQEANAAKCLLFRHELGPLPGTVMSPGKRRSGSEASGAVARHRPSVSSQPPFVGAHAPLVYPHAAVGTSGGQLAGIAEGWSKGSADGSGQRWGDVRDGGGGQGTGYPEVKGGRNTHQLLPAEAAPTAARTRDRDPSMHSSSSDSAQCVSDPAVTSGGAQASSDVQPHSSSSRRPPGAQPEGWDVVLQHDAVPGGTPGKASAEAMPLSGPAQPLNHPGARSVSRDPRAEDAARALPDMGPVECILGELQALDMACRPPGGPPQGVDSGPHLPRLTAFDTETWSGRLNSLLAVKYELQGLGLGYPPCSPTVLQGLVQVEQRIGDMRPRLLGQHLRSPHKPQRRSDKPDTVQQLTTEAIADIVTEIARVRDECRVRPDAASGGLHAGVRPADQPSPGCALDAPGESSVDGRSAGAQQSSSDTPSPGHSDSHVSPPSPVPGVRTMPPLCLGHATSAAEALPKGGGAAAGGTQGQSGGVAYAASTQRPQPVRAYGHSPGRPRAHPSSRTADAAPDRPPLDSSISDASDVGLGSKTAEDLELLIGALGGAAAPGAPSAAGLLDQLKTRMHALNRALGAMELLASDALRSPPAAYTARVAGRFAKQSPFSAPPTTAKHRCRTSPARPAPRARDLDASAGPLRLHFSADSAVGPPGPQGTGVQGRSRSLEKSRRLAAASPPDGGQPLFGAGPLASPGVKRERPAPGSPSPGKGAARSRSRQGPPPPWR